jgi:hypothetical protein
MLNAGQGGVMKQFIGLVGMFMVCVGLLAISGCGGDKKTTCDPARGCGCTAGQTQKGSSNVGECKERKQMCINGKGAEWSGTTPPDEKCNNKDDDCDGQTDEGVADCCENGKTQSCGKNVGECKTGTQTCSNGTWGNCSGTVATQEICNNKDDDCDGQTDEDLQNCGCTGGKAPTSEICDGIDNDCNGKIDDGMTNNDPNEPNNTCGSGSKLLDDVIQGGDTMILKGVLDPAGDEDWFKTCALGDDLVACTPVIDIGKPQCLYFELVFIPPVGSDRTKWDVCLYEDATVTDDCNSNDTFVCANYLPNKNCLTEQDWDDTNKYYVMTLQWDGTCYGTDAKSWYVSVKAKQGQNFSSGCQQYEVDLTMTAEKQACQ